MMQSEIETMTSESYNCDCCNFSGDTEEKLKEHKKQMSDAHDWKHDKYHT